MKANLKQLEEMQKELFKQQCDLDIQKAMLKHFIKKKEDELLTLTDVSVPLCRYILCDKEADGDGELWCKDHDLQVNS